MEMFKTSLALCLLATAVSAIPLHNNPGSLDSHAILQKRGETQFRDRQGNSFMTDNPNDKRIDWDLLPLSETKWNGIFAHGCSSALIQTWPEWTAPAPDLPAYLLTAGHCLAPFMKEEYRGKIYVSNTDFPRSFMAGDTFDAQETDRVSFKMRQINFATMNLTDIAVVELEDSAESILAKGYNFYTLSKDEFSEGEEIEMIGYPGLPDGNKRRISRGRALKREPIDEAWGHHLEMTWLLDMNSWGGFSGSPIFRAGTTQIMGVFTQGSGRYSYGNRAENVHFCFDGQGRIDLNRDGCLNGWKKAWKRFFGVAYKGVVCDDDECEKRLEVKWQCMSSDNIRFVPIRVREGNSECIAYDGKNCAWSESLQTCTDIADRSGPNVLTLACGEQHRSIYGTTGYDGGGGHWCNLAKINYQ